MHELKNKSDMEYDWLVKLEKATKDKKILWYYEAYDNGSEVYRTVINDLLVIVLHDEFDNIKIELQHNRFQEGRHERHPSWVNSIWFDGEKAHTVRDSLIKTIKSAGYISEPLWNLLDFELDMIQKVDK